MSQLELVTNGRNRYYSATLFRIVGFKNATAVAIVSDTINTIFLHNRSL